ncbi:hypothetical protein PR048_023418 [Dryococelus australis]|uniref:HAT C-terminal dimerisation domain-containing protein n=1 Tax=Dryococelus australis TaxID=614101 RepID=A0ABQ9GU46_9NEOP|nr:hypothetical protein PR048_023418 [Dryococelus australis]
MHQVTNLLRRGVSAVLMSVACRQLLVSAYPTVPWSLSLLRGVTFDHRQAPAATKKIKPLVLWVSLQKSTYHAILNLAHQLHSAVASSACIECLFSTFGYVHSSVRNWLGTEKAAKLVTVFRALNNKNIT